MDLSDLKEILFEIHAFGKTELINDVLKLPKVKGVVYEMVKKFHYWDRDLVKSLAETHIKILILRSYRGFAFEFNPHGFIKFIRKSLPVRIYYGYKKELIDEKALRFEDFKTGGENSSDDLVWVDDFSDRSNTMMDLQEALNQLTEKQQNVIKGLYFLGFTEEEIAQCWGIAQQSVNKIRHRALDQLQKNYDISA